MSLLLLNREIGILEFNSRVLSQAEDPKIPLLERIRFLSIVSSNLDEFFEIRMAGIKEQLLDNPLKVGSDGRTISANYDLVSERAHALVDRQYELYQQVLLPHLKRAGITFLLPEHWSSPQRSWAEDFFKEELLPLLTPIALDPVHPFPRVINKSLNFVVQLHGNDAFGRKANLAVVQAPRALPRLVKMPQRLCDDTEVFVFLSSFIQAFVYQLFPGMEVLGCYQFRVTRNSDLFVSDDEVTDLRKALQGELPSRHLGDAVRLETNINIPDDLLQRLCKENNLDLSDCYRVNGPVNLVRLAQLPDLVDKPKLVFKPYLPAFPLKHHHHASTDSYFERMKRADILLHHPYESFEPVLELLREAARDPDVLAMKQTVYRTGDKSPVMEALIEAAQNGKEVTVVLELLARFDEQTNINWAAKLEEVGAHVVYGVVGHKCHAKMLLIVRKERVSKAGKTSLVRYAHLGTGNYHPRTARLYTDFGLMTCDPHLTKDIHHVFQQLTGTGMQLETREIWEAPFTMLEQLVHHIRVETRAAKQGKKARIIGKMNALLEPTIIEELYKASQAGVQVDLIVRGVCALRPGVKGLSENIKVRSIVGRFLEHHRIYYFYAGGDEVLYLSSADWMERNLLRRVEVAFPVKDAKLKQRVIQEGLMILLKDNASAWLMKSDGTFVKSKPRLNQEPIVGQLELLKKFSRVESAR
jgi:polyphosphate kinase